MKRVYFTLTLFFCLTLQGGILDEYKKARQFMREAAQNNLAVAKKLVPYLGDSKPILRDGAFLAFLRHVRDTQAIQFLAQQLLVNRNVLVRENIAELLGSLGKGKESLVAPFLLKAFLRDPKPSVRIEAARSLGELKWKKAVKPLKKVAKKSSYPWLLRGEALSALVAIEGESSLPFLKKFLKDRHYLVQAHALNLISQLDPVQGLKEALGVLKKVKPKKIRLKGWQPLFVSFLAVERAAKRKAPLSLLKEAISQMIELLQKLEGRMFYNDIQFLSRITGESGILPSYRGWKSWWDLNQNRFQPGKGGKKGEEALKRVRTVVRYHGIPIYSTRIVFIVDHSGSMRNPLGEGDKKGRIKFDICKEELIKTIRSLQKKVFFNVFFLESDVFSWQKQLTQATERNKRHAIRYISSISPTQPIGSRYRMRGNFYDGLYKALMDPYADTVFLLSDGGPTAGKYAHPKRVLKKVKQLNRFLHFEIHTILIGATKAKDQRFMEELAEENYGRFYHKGGKKYKRRRRK